MKTWGKCCSVEFHQSKRKKRRGRGAGGREGRERVRERKRLKLFAVVLQGKSLFSELGKGKWLWQFLFLSFDGFPLLWQGTLFFEFRICVKTNRIPFYFLFFLLFLTAFNAFVKRKRSTIIYFKIFILTTFEKFIFWFHRQKKKNKKKVRFLFQPPPPPQKKKMKVKIVKGRSF